MQSGSTKGQDVKNLLDRALATPRRRESAISDGHSDALEQEALSPAKVASIEAEQKLHKSLAEITRQLQSAALHGEQILHEELARTPQPVLASAPPKIVNRAELQREAPAPSSADAPLPVQDTVKEVQHVESDVAPFTRRADDAPFGLGEVMTMIRETAYHWDIRQDVLSWSDNADQVLEVGDSQLPMTGSAFNLMLPPEHAAMRVEMLHGNAIADAPENWPQEGIPYCQQYKFLPNGRRGLASIWIEDAGRWFADEHGKPVKSHGVMRVINERRQEEERLRVLSEHDDLTGHLNRSSFIDNLGKELQTAQALQTSYTLLLATINNLAVINETFGFDVGDEVLTTVAQRLRREMRAADIIGRCSANQFGLLLKDCEPDVMPIAAQRFMDAISKAPIETSVGKVSATISIGGAVAPRDGTSSQDVLSRALEALEQARSRHVSIFEAYKPSPTAESQRLQNVRIADDVVSALDENRMHLALQPIVDSETGKPAFYECLLRMEAVDGSMVSAYEFIPVAEKLGLSRLIDRRVLELAVELLKLVSDVQLAVNVSGLTTSNPEWLEDLKTLITNNPGIAERLIIEITETEAIENLDVCCTFVDTVRELGCQVALDDFGAGYTSFKNLRFLGVDIVKIDGAFVVNMINNPDDQVFVTTLTKLAKHFSIRTVAEWVEDEETAVELRKIGIDYLQGYHYGKPKLAKVPKPVLVEDDVEQDATAL